MNELTHLYDAGHARMVDVTAKEPTVRAATAEAFVECAEHVVAALRAGSVPKGDVLAVARVAGIAAARDLSPDIAVFLDADHSDHPEELPDLLRPIREGEADMVIGSRMRGEREPGALLPQARFGNMLASWLIRRLYGVDVTDLGPFRAIRWQALLDLEMRDTNFGWTAEMQVKAARSGLRYQEVPASYRRRVGVSKITGTVRGTVKAGWKILYTVFRHWQPRNDR